MTDHPIRYIPAMGQAAAMALSAMVRGAEPAFPTNRPFMPKPPHIRDITPRQQRARENQRNQIANRKRRTELHDPTKAARQHQVNGMINWQRTQWAKAGYPQNRIEEFLCLKRRVA